MSNLTVVSLLYVPRRTHFSHWIQDFDKFDASVLVAIGLCDLDTLTMNETLAASFHPDTRSEDLTFIIRIHFLFMVYEALFVVDVDLSCRTFVELS